MSYPAAAAVLEKAVQTLLLAGRARPLVASSHLCVIQLDYVCFSYYNDVSIGLCVLKMHCFYEKKGTTLIYNKRTSASVPSKRSTAHFQLDYECASWKSYRS
jgi:hypothetical protein